MQLQRSFSISQLKALLRKDGLVRLRQPVMTVVQVAWPCLIFMLLYLIRLKFGPEQIEDCQFATRLLPTKNQVLPSFYSYICSLENKCMSTNPYEETTSWKNAPMKPIIDIVNIFVTDDRMFDAVIDLPEKANFINAVTAVVTGGHFNEIRQSIGDVISVVPQVEDFLNGTFDIRRLFSDRRTFVKAGYLMCGHPFPSTDTIPLVNDILYETEDFSKVNDDEINVMPTKYCKQLYLNITTTTTGKLTWNVVKPLIHGKILYAPVTEETQSIMMHANTTFEELNRLKRLSVAVADIVTKLREDEQFQKSFDSLLKLATSPTVRAYIGDDINVDEIVGIVNRIQTDPLVYDVIMTIKNILECFSVDRFIPVATAKDLQLTAYDLNEKRLFFAAAYFNRTDNEVSYKLHMDTENTQPTFENKNRFWFPGPAGSMIRDMKYHRGFVQIKNAIDMGIIKHMKLLHKNVTEETSFELGTHSPLTIEIETGSGFGEDEDDDDWSTPQKDDTDDFVQSQNKTSNANSMETMINSDDLKVHTRKRRQALLDLIGMFGGGNTDALSKYGVEGLQMHTKQFPYPAYTHDDMKTGIYLAQAIQVAFFLGLVAEIASCVRHFIWMRESRNTMIMRSMGMKPYSELTSWILVTFVELVVIFVGVTAILYVGGLLMYASFIFVMFFLIVFGGCLISFCYMCSTFFTSATIGAVATALLFFISYCPYIIVLLFDSHLNSFENFCINLSFTTAFSHAWSHIMRMELQEIGLGFVQVFQEGFSGEFGFAFFMIVLDAIIYGLIGYLVRRFLDDEYCFTEVQREDLDSGVGATMTNVSKLYDEQIAVSDVNLSLPKDKITCLLGRNGAGKSTIIKMLTGQVVQSTGRVILSQAMSSRDEFDKVGVCSQDNILIPNLTAREHLELYASIKLKHNYKSEVDKTLKSLKFGKYEDYQAAQLSGGYQRRLCVALAFIGSPNVVILDEPCNGVDSKARKDIWELIQRLRKGRAVVFATHFLDEAEFLSDVIVIMKNGKIIAKHSPATLQEFCTSGYDVLIHCNDTQTITEIRNTAEEVLASFKEPDWLETGDIRFQIPYDQNGSRKSIDFLNYLQNLQLSGRVSDLRVESRNLAQIFSELHEDHENGFTAAKSKLDMRPVELKNSSGANIVNSGSLCFITAVRNLLWKRLLHFSRNYRILMCVIVLPAIFELFAMWFVTYRLEDDYDKTISFTRELYPKTMQMFSMELNKTLTNAAYDGLAEQCSDESPCREFGNSSAAFHWILKSMNEYQEKRYGGYSFNDTNAIVWYNNKGYHAMMAWLNDLNTKLLQVELGDNNFSITAFNEPWKLGAVELSTTSVLRQAGDSSMVFILLIAFSLVVAVSSVFLVNERVKGEKLQQKLCGVNLATYWGVAFVWDFLVMLLAILVCGAIIFAFGLPVFVARQNVAGIFVLALLFAFACIPGVHVFEKCFNDSSVAIVTIFCLNIIIPLFTMANIVLLGVVGDSPVWDDWRYFLNRAFLVFPQHAFGDGLLEICKNYMVSLVFQRYDIESYKHPIFSDLLLPHMLALFLLGIFFIIINVLLENGQIYKLSESILIRLPFYQKYEDKQAEELKIVSIQNSLKIADKDETPQVLKVDNLYKCYGRGPYVIRNVTFAVKAGECFGLLGKNGTGKSTIFKMLSGELQPNVGAVNYFNGEIAYCPQTNPLDSLLTVEECIRFYGKLRRVANVDKLIEHVLESFQLKSYRHVLVKNLSGGNRRKLTVALTCCGRTTVVLMDEPTSDMDPVTRAIVYRTIHELLAMQRAVVLTSHSVSEIDAICHRIAVLKDGQILTSGSPESLSTQYGGYYDVVVYGDNQLIESVEKAIHLRLPQCVDFRTYTHSIKFSLKIKTGKPQESDSDTSQTTPNDKTITLAGLFTELEALSEQYEGHLHYTVNHCRLDAVFERILDSSEQPSPLSAGLNKSGLMGSPSTGYIHNGYVETETVT